MNTQNPTRPDLIARWLFAVAFMVLLMVVVGGITRLTESGLSMTDWKPVSGIIPPLSDTDWQAEFAHYQASSQYRLMNAGMTLVAFKGIFFWEYLHRVIARLLVGVIYPLPLLWFIVRRQIPRPLIGRLVVIFILFMMQGAVGWIMVASGLNGRMNVEPVKLAAHLGMALLLLSAVVWTALDCRQLYSRESGNPSFNGDEHPPARVHSVFTRVTLFSAFILAILALQIIYGALTAGLRAGVVANTWPLMNDHIFPRGVDWAQGVGCAFVNDPYLVHFIHRWWAWGAFAALMLLARRVKPLERRASIFIHATVGMQIVLGIATVMSGVWLPLAALHQLTGALTLCAAIYAAHVLGRAGRLRTVK